MDELENEMLNVSKKINELKRTCLSSTRANLTLFDELSELEKKVSKSLAKEQANASN
jgi:regulator of replication initiation timing|tara:strand:+ start:362 stop:532 length:171 start_codon:yes stop_codon:yes gene_type:complete